MRTCDDPKCLPCNRQRRSAAEEAGLDEGSLRARFYSEAPPPAPPAEKVDELVAAINGPLLNKTRIAQLLAAQDIFARVSLLEQKFRDVTDEVKKLRKALKARDEVIATELARRPVK